MSLEKKPPHPATVVQPKVPHPATVGRRVGGPAPHPATVTQPKVARPASAERRAGGPPPHPATVMQPKVSHRAVAGTETRPALVAQRMDFLGSFLGWGGGSEEERRALEDWKNLVRQIAEVAGANPGGTDAYGLIERGPFRGENPYVVSARSERDLVSKAMGLTLQEEEALYRYSQGSKDEPSSPGYMDESMWRSLVSAVQKIPSMGDLGVEAVVYRAERKAHFTRFLTSRNGKPCYIVHGALKTESGVQHLASAAFSINNHALRDHEPEGRGLRLKPPDELAIVRMITRSARYIQYWGMHGASLDGGEVLIPAGTISYYDGDGAARVMFGGAPRWIFTLVEASREQVERMPLPSFDDFRGDPA